jgi:hypothetical protein
VPICQLPGCAATRPAQIPALAAVVTRVAAEAPGSRPPPSGSSGVVLVLLSAMRITQLDAEDRTDEGRVSSRLAGRAGFRLTGIDNGCWC